ncbi:hypothetical protein LWI29_008208 [Acer saccharum]|uniref:CCHC-type domain-containing protein n=1 Tax=Acer saccharum TaxID=4024 RepID=A0AA39SDD2_ACESA|nr:hypothetical protein LWI29_008208 [Acer saccharum]
MKFEIDKFDGTGDFGIWRRKVKALLSQQKILKAIEGPDKLPDSLNDEQKSDMLEMALVTIILNLSDNVLREVNDETTAYGVWNKLESLYMTKSLTNKIYLKERLFGFKMNPSKGLGQNLDEFKKMTIELANAGEKEKLSDENEAIILLNSLPESFKDVKAAIKYGRSSLSLEECLSTLKSKELELKIERKDNGENLFVRGRQHVKNYNNNSNNKNKCRSKTPNHRSQSRNRNGSRKCYFCGKEGHIKKYCYEFKKKMQDKTQTNGDAAIASKSYEPSEVLAVSTEDRSSEWILDSGCSFHMCPKKEMFTEFQELNSGSVLMGNNQQCNVEGIGSVALRMYDGMARVFKDVRYVPNLKRNLISLGTLDEEGYTYKAEKGVLKASKGSLVIPKDDKKNGLYVLRGEAVTNEAACIASKISDKGILWHMSERGVLELSKR